LTRLPLFPLSTGLFPDGILQLNIFEVRYLDLIRRCHADGAPFGVVWLASGQETQVPGESPIVYPWGCLAQVTHLEALQPALLRVRCRGGLRFRLQPMAAGPYGVWYADVETTDEDPALEIPQALRILSERLGQWIARTQADGVEDRVPFAPPYRLDECGWVANRWAELLPLPAPTKLALLSEIDPLQRLQTVRTLVA